MNICSVEDPLEIPIAGMNQTQINPRAGLTFHSVCCAPCYARIRILSWWARSAMPTAEIALKAAQTGHLVLSTLPPIPPVKLLTRLQQMGIAAG